MFKHHVEIQRLVSHLAQNKIGGAVDDAGHPFDVIGTQAFAQRLDDGYAARDCGFERYDYALFIGSRKYLAAVHCQQRFVGSHHVLARSNGLHHQLLGNAIATDQFNHHVNVRVGNHSACIADHFGVLPHSGLRSCGIQVGHHRNLNTATSATNDLQLVALEHIEHTAANSSYAQKANLYRFHLFFLVKKACSPTKLGASSY